MLPETLTALACLIANKGTIDTSSIETQLSADEKAQVAVLAASGACLPESLEKLINNTHEKIRRGEMPDIAAGGGSPTFGGC